MIAEIEKMVEQHDKNIGNEIIACVDDYFHKILDATPINQKWNIIDYNKAVCDIVRKVCKL